MDRNRPNKEDAKSFGRPFIVAGFGGTTTGYFGKSFDESFDENFEDYIRRVFTVKFYII